MYLKIVSPARLFSMWRRVLTPHLLKLRIKPRMRSNRQSQWSFFSENVETFQNISTNVEVVETSQIVCPNVSKDLVFPLLATAYNFESPKIIPGFKLSYVSGMWRTLCECITQFFFESSENHKDLEIGFALILNGLRQVDFINLNPLEVLLEDFLKKHRDYDVARQSTSQKIRRDSHQELLSAAQQGLNTANEERINMEKHLEGLQKVFARAEKELKVWTSKKKKTISLIEDHQKRLSQNQKIITNREDEIHAIEKIVPLPEIEIKELDKLKKDAETSLHQILRHKFIS
uniref:Uncharacterized protein n=1 Tax=Solanum lycopersicum TaxID=4081 RepID=A0A3Q7EG81_SOLLC